MTDISTPQAASTAGAIMLMQAYIAHLLARHPEGEAIRAGMAGFAGGLAVRSTTSISVGGAHARQASVRIDEMRGGAAECWQEIEKLVAAINATA